MLAVLISAHSNREHAESSLATRYGGNADTLVATGSSQTRRASEELVLPGNMEAFNRCTDLMRAPTATSGAGCRYRGSCKSQTVAGEIETLKSISTWPGSRTVCHRTSGLQARQSTAERWQNFRKTDSVSQQETDEKVGDMSRRVPTMEACQKNMCAPEDARRSENPRCPSACIRAHVDLRD